MNLQEPIQGITEHDGTENKIYRNMTELLTRYLCFTANMTSSELLNIESAFTYITLMAGVYIDVKKV